jgi:tetratricopeptide (TPR) repeat protein
MAEDFPELLPDSPWQDIEKVEFCLDGVRSAECFVGVITQRHGSAVTLPHAGEVPSSFFELEIFEAALLRKPAFIFLLENFEPDDKLAHLLNILAPCFPHMNLQPVSEDHIVRKIDKLIRHYQRPVWLRPDLALPKLRSLVDILFGLRHRPYEITAEPPPIRFAGGIFEPNQPPPTLDRIEEMLRLASGAASYQQRLTYLWFALRALMRAPYTDPKFRDLVPLWRKSLGSWTGAGAWYGLHGHTVLGCLAALGSLAEAQGIVADRSDRSRGIPHGPLASEYYSISGLAGRRQEIGSLALKHIEAAIETGTGDLSGRIAIQSSIHLRLGNMDAAIRGYQRVAEIRKIEGGGAYGEALSELGYALLLTGEGREGIRLMENGLSLLEQQPVDKMEPGFRIRATRKLAVGYARRGRPVKALELACRAHDLAVRAGARDQIRTLEHFAKRLDRLRFWNHRPC